MSSRSADTLGNDGGASSDHRNDAVVVVPSEEAAPTEGVTAGSSSDAPTGHAYVHGRDDVASPQVGQRGGGGAPAGSTDASVEPPLDPAATDQALRRCYIRLGKMTQHFTEASTALPAAAPGPPAEKLMIDGIRAAATPRLPPRKNGDNACNDVPAAAPAALVTGVRFYSFSPELRRILENLDATEPEYVWQKVLAKSDVNLYHNRFLVSCKVNQLSNCPITHILTEEETHVVHSPTAPDDIQAVENAAMAVVPVPVEEEVTVEDDIIKNEEEEEEEEEDKKKKKKKKEEEEKKKPGLTVMMLDKSGNGYKTKCRYLESNGGYRFIEEWGKFLRTNGIGISEGQDWTRNVLVKLFAFRSQKLPGAQQCGHPNGALGLVMEHHESESRDGGNIRKKKKPRMAMSSSSEIASTSSAARVSPEPDVSVAAGGAAVAASSSASGMRPKRAAAVASSYSAEGMARKRAAAVAWSSSAAGMAPKRAAVVASPSSAACMEPMRAAAVASTSSAVGMEFKTAVAAAAASYSAMDMAPTRAAAVASSSSAAARMAHTRAAAAASSPSARSRMDHTRAAVASSSSAARMGMAPTRAAAVASSSSAGAAATAPTWSTEEEKKRESEAVEGILKLRRLFS
uniref:Uncharacterized protein n=1 Tax=Oryza brachyantha TaxID=4533 RepID=J3MRU1_ORYBR